MRKLNIFLLVWSFFVALIPPHTPFFDLFSGAIFGFALSLVIFDVPNSTI